MLRSTITGARLTPRIATRRAEGGVDGTDDDADQGEVLAAARSGGEALRDARLLLRAATRAASERQAGRRRRRHGEEASAAADAAAGAERRQAGNASEAGAGRGARGSCAAGARA